MSYFSTKDQNYVQNLYTLTLITDPCYGKCEVGGKLLLWYYKLALRAEKWWGFRHTRSSFELLYSCWWVGHVDRRKSIFLIDFDGYTVLYRELFKSLYLCFAINWCKVPDALKGESIFFENPVDARLYCFFACVPVQAYPNYEWLGPINNRLAYDTLV